MSKVMIVAEIGANHLGSITRAKDLIDAARTFGADAVKFQTYTPREIAADVVIESGPWKGANYQDLYGRGSTPWDWHRELFRYARAHGLIPFSSPFSVDAVHRLESIDCPIYKIASPEIIHLPLIAAAATTGKPLIISTGMATLNEIYEAADVAWCNGCQDLTLLHCLSAYPAAAEDFNMETMSRLMHHNFKVGLSDHSPDSVASIMAVTLGATVIEKHLTMRRSDGGPDAKFSLEPYEFSEMVKACRKAERAMGTPTFGVRPSEKDSEQYRRSVWFVKPLKAGEVVTADHVAILRPNYGIRPRDMLQAVGEKVAVDIAANTPVTWDAFQ